MSSFTTQFSHQVNRNFSLLFEQAKQPVVLRRYLVASSIIYISTALLQVTSPFSALRFIHLAYVIDRVSAAFFSCLLEDYRSVTLVPLMGQMAHVAVSILISNSICAIYKGALTLKQIATIGAIFLASIYATKKWVS